MHDTLEGAARESGIVSGTIMRNMGVVSRRLSLSEKLNHNAPFLLLSSNATVKGHFSHEIFSGLGSPDEFRCIRVWMRARRFANSFEISPAHWNSNPGVLWKRIVHK